MNGRIFVNIFLCIAKIIFNMNYVGKTGGLSQVAVKSQLNQFLVGTKLAFVC